MNNINNTNSNIKLSQAVKDLYGTNPNMSVKDILNSIHNSETYASLKDKAHYRAIYNTLKRVSGNRPTPSKKGKMSVVLDLSENTDNNN